MTLRHSHLTLRGRGTIALLRTNLLPIQLFIPIVLLVQSTNRGGLGVHLLLILL